MMVDNEIPYLRWSEFRRMSPPILRLEISRLGAVIDALPVDAPARNALVAARFELRRFVEHVEAIDAGDAGGLDDRLVGHLRAAVLAASAEAASLPADLKPALQYVAERLRYVHDRLPLIY